ncbi:MAG: zinc-dependent alcohol dehydrogenase [Promethearchaeota archaeon]
MKGALFSGLKKIEIREDLVKPEIIRDDEVIIRVKSCGICGSDVEIYNLGAINDVILGHEFSGEIIEVGKQVNDFKVGDRVSVNPSLPCFDINCELCKNGKFNLCNKGGAMGIAVNGGMAEFAKVPKYRLHKLPENVSFAEGATVEPLANALYAVQESKFKKGATAAILGGGMIGVMTAQVLKAFGARKIFLLEPVAFKQQKALESGVDKSLSPEDWPKIFKLTNGEGVDFVYDCAGSSTTFPISLQIVKNRGFICLIGLYFHPFEMNRFHLLLIKNLSVRGIFGFENNDNFKSALDLLIQEKVNSKKAITKKISLEEVPKTFEYLASPPHDEMKVIVEF